MAAMLSLGEPKGDGEAGRLLGPPMTPGGRVERVAGVGAAPLEEARLVDERLERVRFHGRGDARGEPEPMTPGWGRGLALVVGAALAADEGQAAAAVGEASEARALEPRCGEVERCDASESVAGISVGVPKEDAGEKEGREGVQGREVEKVRMEAGRRTGDWLGLVGKREPLGWMSSRWRCMRSRTRLSMRAEGEGRPSMA
jgi:hypothetical protein